MRGVAEKWKGKRFDVVDACAAPGNKTLQLAEYGGKGCSVLAFEKDGNRFKLLERTLNKYETSNVEARNDNFLEVDPSSLSNKVKLILLDPSCSGSGMLTNFKRDAQTSLQGAEQSFE
jgi:25S rRNA (cytosine2278-C5)-methyltransferase